ncbi:MAG: tyrosine-type recombinase/integrase [Firmicutes bacterium]|nr:tyrosine-type recombinase/integrase [Bacillota bacterium]
MTIEKLLDSYFEMNMTMVKKSTKEIHTYYLRSLKACFKELNITNPKKIDHDTGYRIVSYFKENTEKNNDTINRSIRYLKNALKHYDLNSSIHKFRLLSKDTNSFTRFYNDELDMIVQYLHSMDSSPNSITYKTVIFLLLDSGMRISELLNVRIRNIDFASAPYKIFLESTKTGKVRYAPFSDFSKPYIEELISLLPNRTMLFWNFMRNRPMIKNDMRQFYKRLETKLGIERIHSHRFRKTFASLLVENGMPIETLQSLFGHSRVSTTMIYVQYKENKALDSYNDFNKWNYA